MIEILEFKKESLGTQFIFESNVSKPNYNLVFNITDRYNNLFGDSLEFPYNFKITGNKVWDNNLQSTIPSGSLSRQISNLIELKKGYFIIDCNDNDITVKNNLVFNDIVSSNDFNNEFYIQTNPLDSLGDSIKESVDKEENGFILFVILGDNILENDKKKIYNRSDTSKSRVIELDKKGFRPLSFLKKYNSKFQKIEHSLKSRDIFLYIGVIDKMTNELISDTIVIQKDKSKIENSSLLIPLSSKKEEYTNNYTLSKMEKYYEELGENNITYYGLDFHTPFNLLNNEDNDGIEESIIFDDHLNRRFLKTELLNLMPIDSDKQFKINGELLLKEI